MPIAIVSGKELKSISLSGEVGLSPRKITFAGTRFSLGEKTFPLSGYFEQEKDGATRIHLVRPSPDLLALLLGSETRDQILNVDGDADLRVHSAGGKTIGTVALGRGELGGIGFRGMNIDFATEKKGSASFNGSLLPESGEKIDFQGTSREGKVHLSACTGRFALKETLITQPRLELTWEATRGPQDT
jgi:hypothetical protein